MATQTTEQTGELFGARVFSIGANTHEVMVSANECPALREVGIDYCGLSDATAGFHFIWQRHTFSAILFCISGAGEALVDGRLIPFTAGSAYLISPKTVAEYRAIDRSRWHLAWIIYQPIEGRELPFATHRSMLITADATPPRAAVEGLRSEIANHGDPAVLRMWADLLHIYISRATRQYRESIELLHLWQIVDNDLGHDWTVEELASLAHVSREQLRRLCHRQMRCSPIDHVLSLRMRRAQNLLSTSDVKLTMISSLVGYSSPFAFSAAFKRFTGTPPGEYRNTARSLERAPSFAD
jgi:AraC-like DNA-binding protein